MAVPARPIEGAPVDVAWGGVAHDSIVAQDIHAGMYGIPTTVAPTADLTITFPRPFGSTPTVVATAIGGQTIIAGLVSIPTTTQCVVRIFRRDGGNLAAGNTSVGIVAYGPRA